MRRYRCRRVSSDRERAARAARDPVGGQLTPARPRPLACSPSPADLHGEARDTIGWRRTADGSSTRGCVSFGAASRASVQDAAEELLVILTPRRRGLVASVTPAVRVAARVRSDWVRRIPS